MPLGSSTPKRKIYYLSPTTTSLVDNKKVVDPHFKVKMTDENGVTHTLPNEREVSGYLLSTTHGEYEWPKDSGKKVKTITVLLVDADALYKIEMGVNSNVARSIMNTIAGTKNTELLKFRFYVKNDFPQLFITNNDGKCEWKFDYTKDLAPLITEAPDPQDESKKVKIYHKVNAKLMEAWLAVEPEIKAHAIHMGYDKLGFPSGSEKSATTNETSLQTEFDRMPAPDNGSQPVDQGAPPIGAEDDLPF